MTQQKRKEVAMSTGRGTVTAYFAVTFAVSLIAFTRFVHLPVWASFIPATAVGGAVALLRKAVSTWSSPSPPPQPTPLYIPVPPVERRKESITGVLLPSNREDYYFLFSAVVVWSLMRPSVDGPEFNAAAVAVDAVLKRAREVTQQRDPGNASFVRHELASALSEMQADATGHLKAMAESVQLGLPDHDEQRLNKLAAVRKDEAIWQHERKYEQSKREYLGEDVLKDPGSAVVWWLARNNDHVEKTVQDIGLLAQLSSAANNTDIPAVFQQLARVQTADPAHLSLNGSDTPQSAQTEKSAADHFDAFLRAMDLMEGNPERVLFARRVADLAAKHGRPQIAEEMAHRFDTSEDAKPAWEPDDGG